MRRLFLILLLILLFAAGWKYYDYMNQPNELIIDGSLIQLLDEWKSEMQEHGLVFEPALNRVDEISITYETEYCGLSDLGNRIILLSSKHMSQGSYTRKAIFWHELGHSIFQLEHRDDEIMNSTVLTEEYYKKNWNRLKTNYIKDCTRNRINGQF